MSKNKFIRAFKEISIGDVSQVGGKNASLGEMYRNLTKKGLRIPDGFATTAGAYNYFLKSTGLKRKIQTILKGLDTKDVNELMKRGAEVRKLITSTEMPQDFKTEIIKAYRQLSAKYKVKNADVAKLVDALGLGPCGATLEGSIPSVRTKTDSNGTSCSISHLLDNK